MDVVTLITSAMNAIATMIVVVMFVTGPVSLMVEAAVRIRGK